MLFRSLYCGFHLKVGAQNAFTAFPADPVLDIFDFDSRALNSHTEPASGPDPALIAALQNSIIGKAYNLILPERSVLLYDCDKNSLWCGQSAFSFQAIFAEAAKIANPGKPDPDGLALSWYAAANRQDLILANDLVKFQSLKDARIQLLAIANRMDLAQWDGGHWVGAEVHFAYGPTPSSGGGPPNLTIILEFEVPPYDRQAFKKLAQTWSGLSNAPDGQYASQLQDALRSSGFSLGNGGGTRLVRVRSRMNHEIAGGVWRLSQLMLDPASPDPAARKAFAPAKLDDQIHPAVKQDSKLYLGLWQKVQSVVQSGVSQYTIPAELLEGDSMKYNSDPQGMGTPPGVCKASEEVRNVLALQQCSWCHTTESGTVFQHIPNRPLHSSAVPSEFLVGKTLHPQLADLYYGDPKAVSSVPVQYTTYTGLAGKPCQTAVSPPATVVRKFHDVARRTLFLAAIQTDPLLHNLRPTANRFSTFFTE